MYVKIRWLDWLDILLGCWLVLSPWKLDNSFNETATEYIIVLGVILILFNLISVCRLVDQGQEVFNIMLGVLLIICPLILNLPIEELGTINVVLVGGIILTLASWQIFKFRNDVDT